MRAALGACAGAALLTVAFVVAQLPVSSGRLQAQGGAVLLGYNTCAGEECHSKSGEIVWLTQQPGGKEHRGSLAKLRNSRDSSLKYAKAVGLDDFEDPKGMCMKCHATVIAKSGAKEGLGCESCHGPASGYRKPHSDDPKNYAVAVSAGMRDLERKPAKWIPVCRDCHVLVNRPEYEKLINDGEHKDGAKWNVVKKYPNVQTHWKKSSGAVTYTEAQIADAAAGKAVVVASAAPAPAAPPPSPTKAPVTSPATVPPPNAAPPAATPKSAPPPTAKTTTPAPVTAAPAAPPMTTPPARTPPARTPPVSTPPVSTPISTPPTSTPAVSAPPMPPPLPTPADVPPPASLAPPPPTTPAGLLAALQDRVEGFLASLLQRNAAPAAPLAPLGAPPAVSGPDGELLRLQYEAMKLAIEALNLKAKPAAGGGTPK